MMKNRKAFTLVEMLIVIVIIGVLAATILPGLMGARERANDTAKKTALQNLVPALTQYAGDHGQYPAGCGAASKMLSGLVEEGIVDKLPTDPNKAAKISKDTISVSNVTSDITGFAYCALKRGNIENSAFVLMAQVSDAKQGNCCGNEGKIGNGTNSKNMKEVSKLISGTGEYFPIIKG